MGNSRDDTKRGLLAAGMVPMVEAARMLGMDRHSAQRYLDEKHVTHTLLPGKVGNKKHRFYMKAGVEATARGRLLERAQPQTDTIQLHPPTPICPGTVTIIREMATRDEPTTVRQLWGAIKELRHRIDALEHQPALPISNAR